MENKIFKTIIYIIVLSSALLTAGFTNIYISDIKNVALIDDDVITCFNTKNENVYDILKEKGIEIEDSDIIVPSLEDTVENNQVIKIKRAKTVQIDVDDKSMDIETCCDTVRELLKEENIKLGEKDIINCSIYDPIVEGMNINIVRVKEFIETLYEPIPYEVTQSPNYSMDSGTTKIIQKGVEGKREKKYRVTLHNGEEVDRVLLSDKVVAEPVNEISEYGMIKTHKTSRGEVFRYTKVLDMRATAYDLSYESCGKYPDHPQYGITYTGMKARHGVVAVDPNTIPLYSRLYIESADGTWAYRYAVAGDIGGAVKGNIIDLFYDDEEFVDRFGVKKVKVYILK